MRTTLLRYLRVRHEYRQRRLVVRELDHADGRFADGKRLPEGFGLQANERVVEIPWLLARHPSGRMLDAGSSLNHREWLDRVRPLVDELHIVTLVFEGVAYPDRNISYHYGDLRELPYRDGYFDTAVSISTLEHVGMDNAGYGGGQQRADDPAQEAIRAVGELRRVTRDGGRVLISVPYGRKEDHGTFRQLDSSDLEQLIAAAEPSATDITVFRSHDSGWQVSDLDRASDASYRGGFAAEAVACVELTC